MGKCNAAVSEGLLSFLRPALVGNAFAGQVDDCIKTGTPGSLPQVVDDLNGAAKVNDGAWCLSAQHGHWPATTGQLPAKSLANEAGTAGYQNSLFHVCFPPCQAR